MSARRVYLDWNAGAPLREEARTAMLAAFEMTGNPSSVHEEGRAARALVEEARVRVARLAGADPQCVTFTSGGTESNVTALSPLWREGKAERRFSVLLVSAVEHPSVAAGGRFPGERVEKIPVDRTGRMILDALRERLDTLQGEGERALLSLMLANNETGVIQPVAEAAALMQAYGGFLHSDAVQAAGRIPLDIASLGADALTLSAHKIGGPKGIGALIRRREACVFPPLLTGGGQEMRLRGGTEAVALIAGFGAAAACALEDVERADALARQRDQMQTGVLALIPEAVILSQGAERLPNTLAFAIPGLAAETLTIAFDLAGIALSAGSACSSGKIGKNTTVEAMGYAPDIVKGTLRVSLGLTMEESAVEHFLHALETISRTMTRRRGTRVA